MKLIHCSDLHLDARMNAHLDAKAAKARREELLLTFDNIVKAAEREGARAVLIAGDLFDTGRVTPATRQYVGQLIASHPDICFIYVTGNHDRDVLPIFPEERLPDNWVDLSGEGWSSVCLTEGEVTLSVSGTSALERREIYESIPEVQGFHIVMLHGDARESGSAAEDRVLLGRLGGRGIDYLALGHIHTYRTGALERGGVWCYSGCPEGRGFDECGEKGVVLLEVTTEAGGIACSQRFLPIARRTLHRLSVDVSGCENDYALLEALRRAVETLPAEDMVTAVLCGELSPEYTPNLTLSQRLLQDRFFAARTEDETRLALRPEEYVNDVSLKGEFIRAVMASGLPEEERRRIIICGLRALRGEEAEL